MKVLVFVETENGKLKRSSSETVTAAASLTSSENITAISFNGDNEALKNSGVFGASKSVNAKAEDLKFSPTAGAKAVSQYADQNGFDVVLFSADAAGKELAPRVSVQLDAGYISDVIKLENNDNIVATKPVYAGKAIVKTQINTDKKVFTLRPNVFTAMETGSEVEVEEFSPEFSDVDRSVKITEVNKSKGKLDVAEADKIVSGGRGFKGPENFHLVEELADAIGAAVGASRAVVDAGWRPHSEQVGQTGKTVSPSLYVACAISGAVQHLAGMSSSKIIVAINKDADAPIFKVTDYGIVGDVFEVLPKLTNKIKELS